MALESFTPVALQVQTQNLSWSQIPDAHVNTAHEQLTLEE